MAALNSVYNAPERVAGWLNKPLDAVRSETAFDELLEAMVGKKVAVIGHFPGLQKVADRCQLSILERAPQEGDLPDFAAEYVLPEQDFVFVTGTTLTNKTLPRFSTCRRGPPPSWSAPVCRSRQSGSTGASTSSPAAVVVDQAAVWAAGLDGEHGGIFERGAAMVQISRCRRGPLMYSPGPMSGGGGARAGCAGWGASGT